jgi:lysophospholipase L1-like esterase
MRFVFGSIVVAGMLAIPPSSFAKESPVWIGSWACSLELVEPQNRPPDPGLAANTLRQVVHLTLAGDAIRLRLSNEFGATPLTLDSVHIALPAGPGAIRPETDHGVTFSGKPGVPIPAGVLTFSDPIAFPVAGLSDLAVTLKASIVPAGITKHPGSRETSYMSTGDEVSASKLTNPVTVDHWYVLDGVDEQAKSGAADIVTLGDSITDSRGSRTNENMRWPDYLASNLAADKRYTDVGGLNPRIGGNNILHDGLGPSALSRFDRNVIAPSGVRWVLVVEGVNDIGGSRAAAARGQTSDVADRIIAAYQQFILRAHTHGLRIYGAITTPFGKSQYLSDDATEAARQKVNAWIRTSGQFDAVVDIDKAPRDLKEQCRLAGDVDSGDHLHLNSDGYKRMEAAIDLKLFSKKSHMDLVFMALIKPKSGK